jgi:nucleotide-binding universal stress UspA family protein
MMCSFLVVVDGSVQSSLALDRAIEIASALPASEIVLLNVQPELPRWQSVRPDGARIAQISRRVLHQAEQRARSAGITTRAMIAVGDRAETIQRVAKSEGCDHIFVSQGRIGRATRVLMKLTGLSADSDAGRLISQSDVPVTVFSERLENSSR